jgi:hypothetical protein
VLNCIFNPESINIFKTYFIIFQMDLYYSCRCLFRQSPLGEILIVLDTDIKLKLKFSYWCTKFTNFLLRSLSNIGLKDFDLIF